MLLGWGEGMNNNERALELLNAVRTTLIEALDEPCSISVLEGPYFYDGTDCDGHCLLVDIEILLDEVKA